MDLPTPSGQTVLVTGGAGFIGSHLVDTLVTDNDVRVLDDLSSGSRANVHEDATLLKGDIRSTDLLDRACEDIDLVFHQAALVSVPDSIEYPVKSHSINVVPTLALLERAREVDARVVFASSAAIYGEPETLPVAETHPKRPLSPYGLEKLTADHYARLYHDIYDVETVTLRYFNAYGPRQGGAYSGVIRVFAEQARNDEPITVDGDGTQTRDFVHIDDIVQANMLAATGDADRIGGEAFNIGTGGQVSIRELAETVRHVYDSDSEIVHTDPRPADIQESEADISRARDTLDFEPQVSLEDGLRTL